MGFNIIMDNQYIKRNTGYHKFYVLQMVKHKLFYGYIPHTPLPITHQDNYPLSGQLPL